MDQSIDTQVVLTADNSQYDQAMMASAGQTSALAESVDKLTAKISSMTKNAGKSLLAVSAADIASIGAATAAYAAWEHQMAGLQAQAAILNKTVEGQQRTFATYERSVQGLRREFGTTTTEAAALTQVISKMTDQTKGVGQLSNTFTKMSQATGESSTTLATSLLALQRTMGTPQRDTAKYADQLTTLAASANTSASALADFSAQIAPIGRTIGLTQTEVTGVSKAFIQAGQDGYTAANAFNRIMSDIAYATQTGSPDLAKYANLIGVTVSQFKDMGGAEKAIAIFDRLNSMGPRAVTELNRMGLDGTRTLKAITAMSQQTGGLGTSIEQARAAYGSGSTDRGAAAATQGMVDELAKLREELKMAAEAFGRTFAPAVEGALKVMEKLAAGFRMVLDGPFGGFIKMVAAAVAPIAAFGGGLLLMAGTLAKLGAAALLIRGSGVMGLREGFRGFSPIVPSAAASSGFAGVQGMALGRTGAQVAAGGSWLQRGFYNMGIAAGGSANRVAGFGAGLAGRNINAPGMTWGGVMSRMAGAPVAATAWGMNNLIRPQFSPLGVAGYNDPTARQRWITSPMFMGSMAGVGASVGKAADDAIGKFTKTTTAATAATTANSAKQNAAAAAFTKATATGSTAAVKASQNSLLLSNALGTLTGATLKTAGSMTSAAAMATVAGTQMAGRGAMTAMGVMGSKIAAPFGGAAGMTAMAGLIGLPMFINWMANRDKGQGFRDLSGFNDSILAAGNITRPTVVGSTDVGAPKLTLGQAFTLTAADIAAAGKKDRSQTIGALQATKEREMSKEQVARTVALDWNLIKESPEAIQALKLDLYDYFEDEADVNWILNSLKEGMPEAASPLDVLKEDTSDIAFGYLKDVVTSQESKGGKPARYRTQAQNFAAALQMSMAEGDFEKIAAGLEGVNAADLEDLYLASRAATGGEYTDTGTGVRLEGGRAPESPEEVFKLLTTPTSYEAIDYRLSPEQAEDKYEEMEQNRQDALTAALVAAGLDTELSGSEAYDALVKSLTQSNDVSNDIMTRIGKIVPMGKTISESEGLAEAQSNVDIYNSSQMLFRNLVGSGKDLNVAVGAATEAMNMIGDEGSPIYQSIGRARGMIQYAQGQAMTLMSRPDAFKAMIAQAAPILQSEPTTEAEIALKQETQQGVIGGIVEQAQYFKQLLLQQEQFDLQMERSQQDFAISRDRMEESYNLSRARAQADFHQQRKWQEQDYLKARRRAEFDYELSRERGQESFQRNLMRGREDFNISRMRQEQDYQHQVELMQEAAAKNLYNIYERVKVQRTSSSTFLLVNAQDQLQRMQEQSQNLDTLRGMGLSDDAIQQLGLTDSANAQQLSRFVSEVASNPDLIKEFNKSVAERLKAAAKLVTDESSTEWEEFQRQYEIARRRAQQDFRRSVSRSHEDFRIQMDQMEEDFRRSMNRQAADYETAQDRQQKQFSKSMSRAAQDYGIAVRHMTSDFGRQMARAQEDMDLMARSVSMNLKEVLTRSTEELGAEAAKQARQVLRTFNGIDNALGFEGVQIMQQMAEIFGFKYTPPTTTNNGPTMEDIMERFNLEPFTSADGGVLPGYTPGRDVHYYHSNTAQDLVLSGGEAIMRPEWVRAIGGPQVVETLNKKAKYGGFAEGGTLRFGAAESFARSNVGDPYVWGGVGPNGFDCSGFMSAITNVLLGRNPYSRIGSTASFPWPGFKRGVGEFTIGSTPEYPGSDVGHMAGTLKGLNVESRGGEGVVIGSRARGYNDPGFTEIYHLGADGYYGGGGSGDGGKIGLNAVLKDRYKMIERAAAKVELGGGLFEDGFWTEKINKKIKEIAKEQDWYSEGSLFTGPQLIGVGEHGPEAVIPLNERGADFLGELMGKLSPGLEGNSRFVSHSTPVASHTEYNYSIDRSTNFTGEIVVRANNPAEFVEQLRARSRVMALAQASLGGTRI